MAWVLVAILAAVSLFIIANIIRLATFTRREEIAIMKMCGATDGFVRGPFIVEGLILGLMGALVAFFLQWAVYGAVCRAIIGSGALTLFELLEFKEIWNWVLCVFLAAGPPSARWAPASPSAGSCKCKIASFPLKAGEDGS